MDGICSEANEENDNIERPVRRRHSSILKPPRSPLQDIRSGNEIVQETNVLKNRKSSRRVSFADTIKVFQTEPHMKIVRKSEIAETEAGENVLILQNKNSDDNYCEITGMNTLLCAPIQTQMQQKEFSIIKHNHERNENDQTVIFSDENQMDLTASHTVMITKGLSDCTKNENSTKIDTTSFLANLKHHDDNSRMEKELNCSISQNTSSGKINTIGFIKRLKAGKYNTFPSIHPDKENSEIPIYSKESNSAYSAHQISFNADENSINRTRIFREQGDEMNFTQCHTTNIQTLIFPSREANLREFKGDVTIYGSECMDLTVNHTIQISPSASNLSEEENQTQNVMTDVVTVDGTKAPRKKTILKEKLNAAFQDDFSNSQHKISVIKTDIMESEAHTVTQASNQDVKTLVTNSESVCSSPTIQGFKTIFYSSCSDAMELTKCLSSMGEEKTLLQHESNSKMCTNPHASPPFIEKTIHSEDNMDITKSHTITIDKIFKHDQANGNKEMGSIPVCEKEMLQNYVTMLKDGTMNINCSSSQIFKDPLQQRLKNTLSISLTDKKTKLTAGEDMDLTESHTSNLRNQASLTTLHLTPETITKSCKKNHSNEWKKMTESLIQSSQQPNIISKSILTDTQPKEKHQILKISSCLDKDLSPSVDYNQDIATNTACCDTILDKQVTIGHTVQSQHSKWPESQGKHLDVPTSDCSLDKMAICSKEEQTMDLTKSHTIVIGFGPSEIQELGEVNLEHRTSELTTVSRQIAVKAEKCDKSPIGEAGVIVTSDMAALESRSVKKSEFLKEKQSVKIRGRKSIGGLKIDKTMVFSESDENDMDITKSYTVEVNHRSLLDKHDSQLGPSVGTYKTILYSCGQDEMEITRSHTTIVKCSNVLPDEITRPLNKTVKFVDNDELEMTKSHPVFTDYQPEERSALLDRLDFDLSKRKSLQNKVTSSPTEENVFFSENSKSSYPAAKDSKLTVLDEWSKSGPREEAIAFAANDSTERAKLTTWENIKNVQKPEFLSEPLSGKSQRRKSLRLKNDKTITFSEKGKNDMDTTQNSMVETHNKITLEEREDYNLAPLAGSSETLSYTCGQDDMEITRSQTIASECKAVSKDEANTRALDKTVTFEDNHNDLDVTKSHTVLIDCEATEKILHKYNEFGIAREKNLSAHFPKNDNSVKEITEKQEVSEQKLDTATFIPTNTLSSDQSKMEIIRLHRADTDEEDMGKGVNQICISKEAKIESCYLNGTKNVDFASSHIAAICESGSNYFCLPSVISFDSLKGNVVSSCDKNERASNHQVQNELAYTDDLANESYMDSAKTCPLKEEITQANFKGHVDCDMPPFKTQDPVKEPQNETLEYNQNLREATKLNSKRVSFKLPKDQMNAFANDISVASQPHLSTQQHPITQKGQSIVKKNEAPLYKDDSNFLRDDSSVLACENELQMLSTMKHLAATCEKEPKESILTAKCSPNLNNLNEKNEFLDFQVVHVLPPSEQLFELGDKDHRNMDIVQAPEIHNIVSKDTKDKRDEESKNSHDVAEITSVPLKTVVKDKMSRYSLGIFLPKLPNRRNCSVTGVDDLEQVPDDTTDLNHLETQPVSSKESGIGSVAANLNLSPSQYINEENLPVYPGEINSSDSISIDIEEKALTDTSHKEILPSENKMEEVSNTQKRTWVQEEENVPNEKKIRRYDSMQDQEIFDHHTGDTDKNNSVLMKSLSRTPSSCSSSSLDSIKADGISLDFSTQRNSQMESQFLGDTICEESLMEKLKDGRITVREFFILLQVHILIQKPRQSNLPANFTINTSPTPEDLMLRQYVYGPKIEIYREDCELLRQKIEELKVSALNQDKLLTDVNRILWEKMKHCSEEELKTYGIYLNKIKSRYTKMTKVFTHQEKVALYSKLVHSAQNEKEKLQIRIREMDNILKKIHNCLTEVEIETKNLENEEKNNPLKEWDSELRAAEKELDQLKTEEEVFHRELLEVEIQKNQTLAQIEFMRIQTNKTEELLDQLSFSEWDIIEWSDDHAIFTFVYDTIELTITFGELVVGLPFLDKTYRKIAELNFNSLLDEDKAPPSSLLVHKLIFQYIEEQESWKKKCMTQHQVPQMLQELSLVVKHCKFLGEEIEFLKRWGPNYNLMDITVNNTKLTLLFSSSVAFVKFEITLSLSAHYPLVPVPFIIQNHIGNIGHDEIATIISKVPLEDNYLKNVVKQIYRDLLKNCDFYHKIDGSQL